jgi:hypothetical protein
MPAASKESSRSISTSGRIFASLPAMTVYAFYIFDRHGIFLPSFLSVCLSVSLTSARLAECIYKRRWLSRPTSDTQNLNPAETARRADDDAKLVFGTVFSLRNMVRKLGGEDDRYEFASVCSFFLPHG